MCKVLTEQIEEKALDSKQLDPSLDWDIFLANRIQTIEMTYIWSSKTYAVGDLSGDSDMIGTGNTLQKALIQWYLKAQVGGFWKLLKEQSNDGTRTESDTQTDTKSD